MQAENLTYLIQAKSKTSDKWVKVFESNDYEKISNFYKSIKNDIYTHTQDISNFYLISKEAKELVFNYSADISKVSPSRWINIEAIDFLELSGKIQNLFSDVETRLIEVISQTRILNETTEQT